MLQFSLDAAGLFGVAVLIGAVAKLVWAFRRDPKSPPDPPPFARS